MIKNTGKDKTNTSLLMSDAYTRWAIKLKYLPVLHESISLIKECKDDTPSTLIILSHYVPDKLICTGKGIGW